MGPVETNILASQQQQQPQKSKRRSHSNERLSRENSRQKSRRTARSRSNDRESSSSSSDNDREDDNESMDDDDDASASDRSSRGSSANKQSAGIRWDFRTNLIGKRIKETKPLCCLSCRYPVLLVGRLMPCKHAAFCLQCANKCKNDRRNCPKCNDAITDVEKIEAKNLILCCHGAHLHSQDACLRGYTSLRDLQAHVHRRHEQPTQTGQARLDSPHQLLPSTHSPLTTFPGLVVDGPQQSQATQLPPPLMNFPPMNVSNMAPPPLFDMGYRPPNYGLPPQQQQFMPTQPQYRPAPYPPNRSFY
ncbi:unnamed protein product [Rotaria magnacalcarata]|uniref:RING-type domain-containing protein n=2 Tax=Rotaria magnacalcarata TaxID=392030 RepID=A0A814YCS0_9BILA|nr:unnamed protein product [Rotaria magnacalcarata]CAF1350363.1 unnamed protein product [Rotaria magnacalcarata]